MAGRTKTTRKAATTRKSPPTRKTATTSRPKAPAIAGLAVGSRMLKAGRGHYFKRTSTGIALMRGNSATANFTCECSLSGGCRVQIEDQTAMCLESACTGTCGWVVNIPGIAGRPNLALLRG